MYIMSILMTRAFVEQYVQINIHCFEGFARTVTNSDRHHASPAPFSHIRAGSVCVSD